MEMNAKLFAKLEENLKPVWNNLSLEERKSISSTAMDFQTHEHAKRSKNYDPGANPYEMNPELYMRDCLVYHFREAVAMGQRLKKFRLLTPHEQALEALFN